MKDKIIFVLLIMLCSIILIFGDFGPEGKVYDCSLAEWHPDIPTEVKEECRKLRKEIYDRERSEKKPIII